MRIAITCPVFVKNNEHLTWVNNTTESFISKDHDIIFIPVENYVAPEFRPIAYKFKHEPLEISIVKGGEPQSVARAWNLGIREARSLDCEYVLVINTDIVFKSNAIDRLVKFAESFACSKCLGGGIDKTYQVKYCDFCAGTGTRDKSVMWTMAEYADWGGIEDAAEDENYSEHPNFSCYMVNTRFIDVVGTFDENFIPAYCEDGDMHARIALAHQRAYVYGGARFYHKRSNTIQSDRDAWIANTKTFPKNQDYFLRKWGHPIVGDVDKMREIYYKYPYNDSSKDLKYWKPL